MIKKAVIIAADYGTSFLPATKSIPKEMFPIINTPTLQLIVEEALGAGIEEILIITSSSKSIIMDYFDKNLDLEKKLKETNKSVELKMVERVSSLADIHYIYQKEQKGLGHAILLAETFVGDEPFAVLLADDLFKGQRPAIKELVDVYDKYQGSVIGTLEITPSETNKYSITDPLKAMDSEVFQLKGIVEKPELSVSPSLSAILGRYILTPKIFELLTTQSPDAKDKIQLNNSILKLMDKEAVYSYDLKAEKYDLSTRIGYLEAIIDFALDNEYLEEEFSDLINKKAKKIAEKKKQT